MFEKFKRLFGFGAITSDDEPESFDHPRPQRANPNPPRRDWYARVSARSSSARAARAVADAKARAARAVADAKALEALDATEPALSREASRAADELLAKVEGAAAARGRAEPPTQSAGTSGKTA